LEQNIVDAENRLREAKAERDTIEEDGQKLLKCIEELTEQLSNEEGKYAGMLQLAQRNKIYGAFQVVRLI
jgi:septal ring factor EnvC (AmiA/AmiB activator)